MSTGESYLGMDKCSFGFFEHRHLSGITLLPGQASHSPHTPNLPFRFERQVPLEGQVYFHTHSDTHARTYARVCTRPIYSGQ